MKRHILLVMLASCTVGSPELSSTQGESFEAFKAHTYRETWPAGMYIVDGDRPIAGDKQLYEFWARQQQGKLIVDTAGGNDDKWNDQAKLALTYCVSNNFGANKAAVVEALHQATEVVGWETMAKVNFTYVAAQDGNCTTSNTNVVFDVRLVSGQDYLARAFFPSSSRSQREVLVDSSSFQPGLEWPLSHILGHELGHALGFRHEHTRPEAGTCFEDNDWRPLTPYDSASIMHYPQCNGSSQDLNWSAKDKQGVALLYGPPGGGSNSDPDPGTGSGSAHSETRSNALALDAMQSYGAYPVKPGMIFTVTMTGDGDPDLYVRWDATPTTIAFDCRPYIDGPEEECSLTVPSGRSSAYIMVHGYAAASYTLDIRWTSP